MLNDILDGLRSLVQGRGGRTPEDKRKLVRLRCRYKVACTVGNRGFPGTVIDMGLQGMRLETPDRLKPRTIVDITYPAEDAPYKYDTVRCQVAWCRKNRSGALEAGLRYDDEPARMTRSWVKYILRQLGFDERTIYQRRKNLRTTAMIPAMVSRIGVPPMGGRVVNLGVGGALLQTEERVHSGQDVILDIGPAEGLLPLSIPGRILTDRFETQSQSWLQGIRFRTMDDSRLAQLTQYIVTLLRDSQD